ncbi:Uncharacterised protein [uncultured archaeon]|nr:Uncharacterised protein [uncultured archaeon]
MHTSVIVRLPVGVISSQSDTMKKSQFERNTDFTDYTDAHGLKICEH